MELLDFFVLNKIDDPRAQVVCLLCRFALEGENCIVLEVHGASTEVV